MTNKTLLLLIILISTVLIVTPVSAKIVTAKVDDKGIIIYGTGGTIVGTLHTCYGEIIVSNEDYNNIEINDTIRYDTCLDAFWGKTWKVERV